MDHLFFRKEPVAAGMGPAASDHGYTCSLWTPSAGGLKPSGMPLLPWAVWWLFHRLHIFANEDYGILLIHNGNTMIHRSGVFPGYLRFPFMAETDLQIGYTWTHPDFRGKGLATSALKWIARMKRKTGRRFWYIAEQSNLPSIRAAKKAGFEVIGKGRRRPRFGVNLLGYFEIGDWEVKEGRNHGKKTI